MNRVRIRGIADAWAVAWAAIWWPIWDRVAAGELSPEQAQALAMSRIDTADPVFLKYAGMRARHPRDLEDAWKASWAAQARIYLERKVDELGSDIFSKRVIQRQSGSVPDCN